MFDDSVWAVMDRHARDDYPSECCGIVTLDADDRCVVHPCENIQDKLHAADPQAHPRTAKTAYRMNDMQVMRIQTEAEKAGGRMVAIYHSHIDVDAYFSEEDQQAAMFFGEPAYPGVVYPVISVVNGQVENRKIFKWNEAAATFEELIPGAGSGSL